MSFESVIVPFCFITVAFEVTSFLVSLSFVHVKKVIHPVLLFTCTLVLYVVLQSYSKNLFPKSFAVTVKQSLVSHQLNYVSALLRFLQKNMKKLYKPSYVARFS